ncbi:MAG: hypothetical protein JSS72_03885 [Armatimonadetes bacterium]|nr:hypothetical protein [Armatimonadota bacterium]
MKATSKPIRSLSISLAMVAASAQSFAAQTGVKGMAVAYPWVFEHGHKDAWTTTVSTAGEILQKAGYAPIPTATAQAAWTSHNYPAPTFGNLPSKARLLAFGKALHARKVLYGSVSWHTRSIWVNLGPRTISTATINAYVLDVATGKVEYTKKKIEGRSDEKANGYKIAADILVTPLVTAVSGGPATPQEQRAVQIGLAVAYESWIKKK